MKNRADRPTSSPEPPTAPVIYCPACEAACPPAADRCSCGRLLAARRRDPFPRWLIWLALASVLFLCLAASVPSAAWVVLVLGLAGLVLALPVIYAAPAARGPVGVLALFSGGFALVAAIRFLAKVAADDAAGLSPGLRPPTAPAALTLNQLLTILSILLWAAALVWAAATKPQNHNQTGKG